MKFSHISRQVCAGLLFVFVLSICFTPIAHALTNNTDSSSVVKIGDLLKTTESEPHASDHHHDDNTEITHTHEHNPFDHSHEVPAVLVASGGGLINLNDRGIFPRTRQAFPCSAFEIDRPPRL